jgi:hypothetical protein
MKKSKGLNLLVISVHVSLSIMSKSTTHVSGKEQFQLKTLNLIYPIIINNYF